MNAFVFTSFILALIIAVSALPHNEREDEKQVYAPNYKPGDKCPAKFFHDGCNSCVCGYDGVTAACTLKLCLNYKRTRRAVETTVYAPNYKPGDKCPAKYFHDGCNACVCSNGISACTLKACL